MLLCVKALILQHARLLKITSVHAQQQALTHMQLIDTVTNHLQTKSDKDLSQLARALENHTISQSACVWCHI